MPAANIAYTQWLVYCILQGFSPAQTFPRFDSGFARNLLLAIPADCVRPAWVLIIGCKPRTGGGKPNC